MRRQLLVGILASVVGLALAFSFATPTSAATNLSFGSQVCQADGRVSGLLSWTPTGQGSQRVDLATNANFTNVSTGGPYSSTVSQVRFVQLTPGATYYARVRTAAPSGQIVSPTLALTARTCPAPSAISAPTNLTSAQVGATGLRFNWTPGANNTWYCVDTARSLSDLVNTRGTWRNHSCWNTSPTLTVTNLSCGTTYYWLVYAWNRTANIKSTPAVAQTAPCPSQIISPATNLHATAHSDGRVTFNWTPGVGNIWYCVDTAPTQAALLSANPAQGWRNHGCWNTSSTLTVSGLACETRYFWLVYSWNRTTNTKSTVSTVNTAPCTAQLQEAPIVSLNIVRDGNAYRAEITAARPNACHSQHSHRVDRQGNTIRITVLNQVRPGPCALVYSEYNLNVNLGTDFVPGQTYQVIANNVSRSFTAAAQLQEAQIVSLNVTKVGNAYRAEITAALPDACHSPHSHRVDRQGNTIRITVWNQVQPGPCAFVYSEYDLSVNLGTNFIAGQTYHVIVNNVSHSFVASN